MIGLPEDLDLLLALDVLLRERHVTRAAGRLGITQSAVSQQLARLRLFFGDPLLIPARPGMTLTARAEAIEGPLARALAELRAAVRAGEPFDPAVTERRFVILANDLFEAYAVPLLLREVSPEAPGLTFQVERAEADYADRLERGTADFAFVPGFALSASLRRLPMPKEPFVALLRSDHPAAKKPLTLERYLGLDHLLIAPRGLPGSLVDDALQKIHRKRRVVARVQHFAAAPFIIAETDLVLTCVASVARLAAPFPVRSVPVPVELPIDETFLVWHERAHNDPGHAWLRGRIDTIAHEEHRRRANAPPRRARPAKRTKSASRAP